MTMAKLAGSILLAALSMAAVADRGADLSQAGATEPAVRAGAQGGPGRARLPQGEGAVRDWVTPTRKRPSIQHPARYATTAVGRV